MSLTTLSLELIESIKQNYALLKKINLSNNGAALLPWKRNCVLICCRCCCVNELQDW